MTRFSFSLSTLALLAATPAFAETLAADLWAEWQAQAELTGQSVSATVTETETGLTLSNFTTTAEEDGFSTRGAIDEIEMTENSDGTVSVTYSELYSTTFTFEVDAGDPPANIELQLRHEGLDLQVSGEPGNRTYTYAADRLTLTDGAIWGGGGEPPTIDLDMVISDMASTYSVTGDTPETMRFDSTGRIGRMQMALEVLPPPGETGRLKMGMVMGAAQGTSAGTFLSLAALSEADGALPDGLDLNGTTSYDSFALEFEFVDVDEQFAITYTNAGGRLGFGMSETEISYEIAGQGMQTRISAMDLPVPIDLSVASSEATIAVPLSAGDAPQDVMARIAYEDIALGDSLWAMIDPTNAIPRDPASLILDATGQVQLFVDLISIDPETMTGPPGELRGLSVNELRLDVGGAELSGTADVSFAPGQLIPMPAGAADLQLSGGNALLDALIAGGMVPAEQGAFVRGMANAFARPGAAPDTLETSIEFGEDGSITANGIPLQ
ncbi:DUF2125 domain-containing protein [Gymnodinialimonas ulvae]|uniref:DUF2125 domain-containing protein n=1 Tax=Gymnodinialimonas ulvae TaxID=3126504 RepID=UPI00309DBD4B